MLHLTQYVRVLATGTIGRIEQWTQSTNQYLVEFNRDSSRDTFPALLILLEKNSQSRSGASICKRIAGGNARRKRLDTSTGSMTSR